MGDGMGDGACLPISLSLFFSSFSDSPFVRLIDRSNPGMERFYIVSKARLDQTDVVIVG